MNSFELVKTTMADRSLGLVGREVDGRQDLQQTFSEIFFSNERKKERKKIVLRSLILIEIPKDN